MFKEMLQNIATWILALVSVYGYDLNVLSDFALLAILTVVFSVFTYHIIIHCEQIMSEEI